MTALVIRMLARGDWGQAMLAELAAIDDPRARRRFALGCIRALFTRSAAWLRVATLALVLAVPTLMFSGPGHGADPEGLVIVGAVTLTCLLAAAYADPSVSALAAGLIWWGALLLSATVREHPQWALIVIGLAAVAARRRALSTAFVTCLAVFVVSVGTYAALPRLAPNVVPANVTDPVAENQIESTDPYVGELLLAGLFGIVVVGAVRARPVAL
ncbi:hypothetical protein [Solirubrobacter soli]|uniref:hypothetical protein n=1 Tax=Solirubrobacter soli TaxID=363832 RepID=UPI0003FC7540|nr:hypothetical protein [Solirubrobacter soli]